MEILIIIIPILILVYWLSYDNNKIKPVDRCEVHSWGYDTSNQMYCKVCKRIPGKDLNE